MYALAGFQRDFFQRFLTRQKMAEVVFGACTQRNLCVGQAQVGVKQHDIMATLRQSHGEVDRHSGFAYPALAAGNADDLGGFKLAHALPLCAVPPIG